MDTVQRHSPLVRWSHWLIALSGLLLLFSGFGQMPMYKRYYITAIPGLSWAGDYTITLLIHYIAASVFGAAIVFHLVYHIRLKELAIAPRRGDLRETFIGLLAMVGLASEPRHTKFQAKQRVAYAFIGVTSLLLVLTGLIKSYKNLGSIVVDPILLQWMAMLHTFAAVLFLLLIIAHVAALLLKSHRPLIPSMFTGRISREYAEKHHPAWKIENTGGQDTP